jgi:N-acetylmuramoyl-L-alanine amidase
MRRAALVAIAVAALALPAAAGGSGAPVVVIDPGHNLKPNLGTEPIGPGSSQRKITDGGGATGVATGTPEAVLTLAVSLRLRRLLQGAGVRVIMTRTRTDGINPRNSALAAIANRAHAALFLRIHADGTTDHSVRGTHTLYPAYHRGWTDDIYRPSLRAAKLVQRALVHRLGFPDRGLDERPDIAGFNWSNRPAILVEMGFLSNPTEDRLLQTSAYRRRAALGLCEGTLRFVGLPAARCSP